MAAERYDSWEEFIRKLEDANVLWNLPKKDKLADRISKRSKKLVDDEVDDEIIEEVKQHWMIECDEVVLDTYDADTIADSVGIKAQRNTNDFDSIVDETTEKTIERVLLRQYISEIVFEEDDLLRPWEREDYYVIGYEGQRRND